MKFDAAKAIEITFCYGRLGVFRDALSRDPKNSKLKRQVEKEQKKLGELMKN